MMVMADNSMGDNDVVDGDDDVVDGDDAQLISGRADRHLSHFPLSACISISINENTLR